jgi:small subunit ribosomal protein S9
MAPAVKEKKAKKSEMINKIGRRKTSVARVVVSKGNGKITVNGKDIENYFPKGNYVMIVNQPLKVIDFKNDHDFSVNVYGGGMSGQAGAIRHAIARALCALDINNKKLLKTQSLMTRDPRMVERKKYGQKKARKRFQFSKR